MKRIVREPLLHFTVLGLLIFGGYHMLSSSGPQNHGGSIVVSAGKIEQMAAIFSRTWQRPPSPEELKGLIDDYVMEEIYVREALALGLDTNDTVIRRRLRQKVEFMTSAEVDTLIPTEADLQAYMDVHSAAYSEPPQVAFQQVLLDPDRHPGSLDDVAKAALQTLRADPAAGRSMIGDASLLPADLSLGSLGRIEDIFGPEVAAAVEQAELLVWTGPIGSPYGLHLVHVSAREPGRTPTLSEVRDAVLRDWTNAKRLELEAAGMAERLSRYEVRIETGSSRAVTP